MARNIGAYQQGTAPDIGAYEAASVTGVTRDPGAGSAVLAGQAPALLIGYIKAPSAKQVALLGYAPSAEITHVRAVGQADATLAGQAPTAISFGLQSKLTFTVSRYREHDV